MSAADWNRIGATDPYWGVLAREEYRGAISDEMKTRFLQSGEHYAQRLLATIQRMQPGFRPRRALDFGCGVGRVTIPLARECDVVGVDVSDSMIAEARRNVAAAGVASRVTFSKVIEGQFDLVHSLGVLQHVPWREGVPLLAQLVGSLAPGGVAVLDIPYWREASPLRRAVYWTRGRIPGMNGLVNLVRRRRWSDPLILMERYDLNVVMRLFLQAGISRMHVVLEYGNRSENALIYLSRNDAAK